MGAFGLRPLVYVWLTLVVCAIYYQVAGFDFLNFDDNLYVTQNQVVRAGLTWSGLVWAFTDLYHVSNWHPLTWLSHMLDVELFGLQPGYHHLTNVALHLLNSWLLFLVLRRMTTRTLAAAAVATLFAVHPTHVESVAWVAERKDVLSTFFMLLALLAYASYARRPSGLGYALVLCWFSLGLMAKPMLITFPFVLLLIDVWPLRRLVLDTGDAGWGRKLVAFCRQPQLRTLVIEKLPLCALTLASAVVTLQSQESARWDLRLGDRLPNVIVAYGQYVAKAIRPGELTHYYPFAQSWSAAELALSIAIVLGATALVLRFLFVRPALFVGWFWFLGTLVPVIGIVQVGTQAMADRYTYIPYIGLFIMVVYGAEEFVAKSRKRLATAGGVLAVVTVIYGFMAHHYLGYWQHSIALWSRNLMVVDPNYYEAVIGRATDPSAASTVVVPAGLYKSYFNMALALTEGGLYEEALKYFAVSAAISDGAGSYYYMGIIEAYLGHAERAAELMRKAHELDPKLGEADDYLPQIEAWLRRPGSP